MVELSPHPSDHEKSLTDKICAWAQTLKLESANEAETRLKVIDQVIFEILGWTLDDVKVEDRVSEDGKTTFADYVMRTAMTGVVVEAKKIGASFADLESLRRFEKLSVLMKRDVGDAIVQARDYARKLGIQFAAVTNGNQWIIFPALRTDQVAFQDSSAIVFSSNTDALQDNLVEFKQFLSREFVITGSLENSLTGRIQNQIERRRLGSEPNSTY